MIAHNISIRYTGRMATIGAMDAGYVDKAMAGMRVALAAHCHFLTTGRVPDRVTSKSRDFRVVAGAPRHGSVDLQFVVLLVGGGWVAAEILKHLGAGIFEEAGKDLYKIVLGRHFRAWLKRFADREGLTHEEANLSRRIEPRLPWPELERAAFDTAHESKQAPATDGLRASDEVEYRKLLARTDSGLTMSVNPVGREGGSSSIEFRIDDEFIGHLGERHTATKTRKHDEDFYRRVADEIERMRRHT